MRNFAFAAFAFAQISTVTSPNTSPNVSLRLDCVAPDEIRLTVANKGGTDTAVVFGYVLANGGRYVPTIVLTVSRPGTSEPQVLRYHPVDLPGGTTGRVDPWILPLPAKATFLFDLRTIDFVSTTERLKAVPTDRLQIRFVAEPIRDMAKSDMPGMGLWRVWTGQLESNPIQMVNCPLEVLRERIPQGKP